MSDLVIFIVSKKFTHQKLSYKVKKCCAYGQNISFPIIPKVERLYLLQSQFFYLQWPLMMLSCCLLKAGTRDIQHTRSVIILLKLDSLPVTSHSIDANCIFMHPAQPAKNTLIGWGCILQVTQPCLNKVKQNTMHLK